MAFYFSLYCIDYSHYYFWWSVCYRFVSVSSFKMVSLSFWHDLIGLPYFLIQQDVTGSRRFLSSFFLFCFWFFWPRHTACGILVSQLGVEPIPAAVGMQSPNPNWTTREVPHIHIFKAMKTFYSTMIWDGIVYLNNQLHSKWLR